MGKRGHKGAGEGWAGRGRGPELAQKQSQSEGSVTSAHMATVRCCANTWKVFCDSQC